MYSSWSAGLPLNVEICSLQFPGRENRLKETLITRITSLVLELTDAISPELTKPFAFFGHSMGALIAFELVRELYRQKKPSPLQLIVSGHRAPQLPDSALPIHALPENEFIKEIGRLNGTPEIVLQHEELMRLVLPTLRADLEMCETYQYLDQAPLQCPILAFGGLQDPKVDQKELTAWQEQTSGSFELQMFTGNHFFLHTSRGAVLHAIASQLQQK